MTAKNGPPFATKGQWNCLKDKTGKAISYSGIFKEWGDAQGTANHFSYGITKIYRPPTTEGDHFGISVRRNRGDRLDLFEEFAKHHPLPGLEDIYTSQRHNIQPPTEPAEPTDGTTQWRQKELFLDPADGPYTRR